MTIHRAMPALEEALNEQSWEWLQREAPNVAAAVATEVRSGASPADIRRQVMRRTQRDKLAARCEQAALYLVAQKEVA
jgi:hypothetical protein